MSSLIPRPAPDRPAAAPTMLRVRDLDRYLLHRNGNDLYRIPVGNHWAVLKVYSGSRRGWSAVMKTIGNWVVADQTSVMPRARRRKELECLDLWRSLGFLVFETIDGVRIEGLDPEIYAVYGYVDAVRFVEYFADRSIPLPRRLQTWRRFLPVWHRRHALAVEREDPRLVHENGDLKHVMIVGDDFLFFDFETTFRSRRRIREVTAREILCYLKSMGRTVPADEFDVFLEETVAHYPGREFLEDTARFAFKDPNPLRRVGRAIDRRVRSRARKRTSKYQVASRIFEILARRVERR